MKKGIQKRVTRIEKKGEATGKDAKALAKTRAKTYRLKSQLNPQELKTVKSNAKIVKKVYKKRGQSTKGVLQDELKRKVKGRGLKPIKKVATTGAKVQPKSNPAKYKSGELVKPKGQSNAETTMQTKVIDGQRYTKSVKEWQALRKANPGFFKGEGQSKSNKAASQSSRAKALFDEIRKSAGVK